MAAYFAVLGWRFGFSLDLLMVICFSVPLLIIGLVDFWTRLIHTNVIFLGVALGWVFAVMDGGRGLLDSVIGMAVGGAYLHLLLRGRNPDLSQHPGRAVRAR